MAETSITKYVIDYSTIKGIGDAIRTKEGSTELIPIRALKQRILDIQTGIDTSDATAVESEVLAGEIFYANGVKKTGTMPSYNIDNISVEWRLSSVPQGSGDATMVVDVQEGHYEAGAYPVGTLAMYQPSDITPGTADIEVPGGAWYMNSFTVFGDENLVAGNIKSGVSIFGVDGSLTDYAFENWTLTLDNGTTVNKSVAVASLGGE